MLVPLIIITDLKYSLLFFSYQNVISQVFPPAIIYLLITNSAWSRRPCFDFARGNCRFGNKCKYSHGTPAAGSSDIPPHTPIRQRGGGRGRGNPTPSSRGGGHGRGNTPGTPSTPLSESELLYREWRRGLNREGELSPAQMESFSQDAIKVMETASADVKQFLVKDLGDEKGLIRIRQIVGSEFSLFYSVLKPMFKRNCIPFLKLISHEEIQSSLVLEAAVGTIFNVIYGPDGLRGITFFQRVSECLLRANANPDDAYGLEDGDAFEEALAATAAALLNTIRLNQGAAVQTEFKDIVGSLRRCYDQDESTHSSFAIRSAHQDIERIRERLQMGELIAPVQSADSRAAFPDPAFAQSFQLPVDLPGSFSQAGIRHDNDFGLITSIKILPTTSEIKSDRYDFLPLRGVNSPHHLRGIHRLLDSQFRLLREDTSGQLRDGVRHLLDNWNVLVTGTDAKAKRKILRESQTRIRIYEKAQMERFRYDRKKGLAIDVSFDQPKKTTGLTKKKRIEWWKGCKELEVSSLVALVGNDKETTFLSVTARTIDTPRTEDPDQKRENVLDDLISNDHRAVITLSLADPNNALDQSRMIDLAQNRVLGGLIMVEFPGILYVSFEPILKCLQSLHQNPILPFAKWIIPQPEQQAGLTRLRQDGIVKVPPPLYLARNRAPLDLKCIATNGQALSFSIDNPVTVRELLANTTLDRGQCEALITGLQNELALIQGPPGTGKSHVGLQLAKVLLANREQTKIGPIICV